MTSAGKGSAGVKWWLIELGGEISRESVVTQTVKITLEPKLFDEQGKPLEFLIDAPMRPPRPAAGRTRCRWTQSASASKLFEGVRWSRTEPS